MSERRRFSEGGHVGRVKLSDDVFWFTCICGYSAEKVHSRREAEIQGASHALKVWPEVARKLESRGCFDEAWSA